MPNQNVPSSQASGMKFEVVSLNRRSSQAEDSPEQVHLDRIFNFKFIECNIRANQSGAYREDRSENMLPISVSGCALLLGWLFLTLISSLFGRMQSMEKEFVISILLISGCITTLSLLIN